ncbi:MAG: 2-oxoisovalerate dehydrogenase [Cyanobacteria bacterium J06639_1]
MSTIVFLVTLDPEGGWIARAVEASIFTEAETLAALRDAIREAVRCHYFGRALPQRINARWVDLATFLT